LAFVSGGHGPNKNLVVSQIQPVDWTLCNTDSECWQHTTIRRCTSRQHPAEQRSSEAVQEICIRRWISDSGIQTGAIITIMSDQQRTYEFSQTNTLQGTTTMMMHWPARSSGRHRPAGHDDEKSTKQTRTRPRFQTRWKRSTYTKRCQVEDRSIAAGRATSRRTQIQSDLTDAWWLTAATCSGVSQGLRNSGNERSATAQSTDARLASPQSAELQEHQTYHNTTWNRLIW